MEMIKCALRSLAGNRVRSLLTMTGIIIGVGSVIVMVSLGRGAAIVVEDYIASFGENIIHVFPAQPKNNNSERTSAGSLHTLTLDDAKAVAEECFTLTCAVPMMMVTSQVIYSGNNWKASIRGTTPDFLNVRPFKVERGLFITDTDVRSGNKVCVLGATPARELFGQSDPIDSVIRIGQIPFRVIGLLNSQGIDVMGNDDDDIIIVPVTAVQQRLSHNSVHNDAVDRITVQAKSRGLLDDAKDEITAILRQRHRINDDSGDSDDFQVFLLSEVLESTEKTVNALSIMLSLVAGISLVIGGIGIMNIMLVTVTERTHEIGIRMAVGARPSDIRVQFLTEAAVLSAAGGFIGIALGAVITEIIASQFNWPAEVSADIVIISSGFSVFIGMFFGLWPAWKASRLDPIEALRAE
ncbi:MAG: ABC transporter permease [Synergistaceae bacterium]|nr:ABC transporter permease [Synergistaceae bacterium]